MNNKEYLEKLREIDEKIRDLEMWCDTSYFPVNEDVYKAYVSYSKLNEARRSIMNLSYAPIPGLVDAEFSSGVIRRLEEKMNELNEKYKLFKHPSFQHIEKVVYI